MKKFIFLPFIALIILTGCKSNSFNSQRYTKYGHAAHKQSTPEVAVVKKQEQPKEVVETEVVKPSESPVQLVASTFSALKEHVVKPKRKAHNLNTEEENMVTIQGEEFSKDQVSANSSKASVQSQKVVKEKTHARGLIGSAFETALWIVLVVIFVILIVFLLSVIF